MALSSYQILQKVRGSDDGTPPFTAGSLGAYIESNFGGLGSAYSWQMELYPQSPQILAERRMEAFRIGLHESSSQNTMLVEDDRPDLIRQPYTVTLFKKLAREGEYGEHEERYIMDLKDAILEWSKDSAVITNLTLDANSEPTLLTFSYITTNNIIRDRKFVYLEMTFNALRQL